MTKKVEAKAGGTRTPGKIKKRSQFKSIWFRYRKNKLAMFGLILLLIIVAMTVFAPLFISYDAAIEQEISNKLQSPGAGHPFGTDMYGRDMFARVLYGGRISLSVGLGVVALSLFFGAMIGSVAAYYGGTLDNVLMRIMDVFLAISGILMAIAVVAALGQGIGNILIAMSISRIPQFARIVRSAILSIKGQEFIEAAKACGTKDSRIILKHILPNAIGPIVVQTSLSIASAILGIAGMSFVGLGITPPTPEWGSLLAGARSQMRYYPYLVTIPGLAIMLAALSFNLIGDGLRDALDPRLKN